MIKKILIFAGLLLALPVFVFGSPENAIVPDTFTLEQLLNYEVMLYCEWEEGQGYFGYYADRDLENIIRGGPINECNTAIWDNLLGQRDLDDWLLLDETYKIIFGEEILDCTELSFDECVAEEGFVSYQNFYFLSELEEEALIFDFPQTAVGSTTAYIGGLFTDIGVFIWIFIGIPLGFVVVRRVIKILPK